jgi:peptidoglycan/xylan/chitin deacetylase (PgdA/CDA1 family)
MAALLLVALIMAGIVGGAVWALGRGGGRAAQTTVQPQPPPPPSHPQKPAVPPTLEERGRAAVERLVKLGLPLYCGGHKGRYVALTFDDGPGPYTELYAFKILRQAKARATWFVVGRNIAGWPTLPRRELAFGAVGDHTWTHAYLPRLDPSAMRYELASTQTALRRATGRPVKLFRPPYGARNAAIDSQAKALGMLEVLWSIDSLDSQGADWQGITREVLDNLEPGSIVLMHENRGQTIRALKFNILPELRKRRYKTVSIPELLALDPPTRAQLRAGPGGC